MFTIQLPFLAQPAEDRQEKEFRLQLNTSPALQDVKS